MFSNRGYKKDERTEEPTAPKEKTMDNTININTADEIGHDGKSHQTKQMETDTTTEEREVLIQRSKEANTTGEARALITQIYEHKKMYKGDAGIAALDEQLTRLETMLGE